MQAVHSIYLLLSSAHSPYKAVAAASESHSAPVVDVFLQ